MRSLIGILLFVFILSRIMLLLFLYRVAHIVHPENLNRDIHELVVKQNSELLKIKEKFRAFEGKVDY